MNTTTHSWQVLVVLAILGLKSPARGEVFFTETFSYPDGHLASAPPAGGVSSGLWTTVNSSGFFPVDVGGGIVHLHDFTQPPQTAPLPESVQRAFPPPAAGLTVYAGLDVSASGNNMGGLLSAFAEFSSRTVLFVTPFAGSDYTLGIGNESLYSVPTVSWPVGLTFAANHRVVMSFESNNGTSKLWVDPINESSPHVSLIGAALSPPSAFSLRQYKTPQNTPSASQEIDNLIVGTSFNDVLAVPTLNGDYNRNGSVGPEDYIVWKANYGSTANLAADGNNDHIVDAADYTVWRNNLGAMPGSGGVTTALYATVPEPATLVLASSFLLTFAAGRRSHTRQTRPERVFCSPELRRSMPAQGEICRTHQLVDWMVVMPKAC